MVRHRSDHNQSEIVRSLRECGCEVHVLSQAGKGAFDLLVEHKGILFLVEIKQGNQEKALSKLTKDQKVFFKRFGHCINVIVGTSAQYIFAIMDGVVCGLERGVEGKIDGLSVTNKE